MIEPSRVQSQPRCSPIRPVPGLLREPRAAGDRVALRRPARLAARDGRPQRERLSSTSTTATRRCAMARAGWRSARYGMPFSPRPKARVEASSRACRAVVAARPRVARERVGGVPGAPAGASSRRRSLLDDDEQTARGVERRRRESTPTAIVSRRRARGIEAYERDKAETRTAAGSPTELQGKAGNSDGAVRYTAPSVVFTPATAGARGGRFPARRGLRRADRKPRPDARAPAAPEDPAELLEHFESG